MAIPHALQHEHPHAPQIFFKSEQKKRFQLIRKIFKLYKN